MLYIPTPLSSFFSFLNLKNYYIQFYIFFPFLNFTTVGICFKFFKREEGKKKKKLTEIRKIFLVHVEFYTTNCKLIFKIKSRILLKRIKTSTDRRWTIADGTLKYVDILWKSCFTHFCWQIGVLNIYAMTIFFFQRGTKFLFYFLYFYYYYYLYCFFLFSVIFMEATKGWGAYKFNFLIFL